jgi:hypothetical protein
LMTQWNPFGRNVLWKSVVSTQLAERVSTSELMHCKFVNLSSLITSSLLP